MRNGQKIQEPQLGGSRAEDAFGEGSLSKSILSALPAIKVMAQKVMNIFLSQVNLEHCRRLRLTSPGVLKGFYQKFIKEMKQQGEKRNSAEPGSNHPTLSGKGHSRKISSIWNSQEGINLHGNDPWHLKKGGQQQPRSLERTEACFVRINNFLVWFLGFLVFVLRFSGVF